MAVTVHGITGALHGSYITHCHMAVTLLHGSFFTQPHPSHASGYHDTAVTECHNYTVTVMYYSSASTHLAVQVLNSNRCVTTQHIAGAGRRPRAFAASQVRKAPPTWQKLLGKPLRSCFLIPLEHHRDTSASHGYVRLPPESRG